VIATAFEHGTRTERARAVSPHRHILARKLGFLADFLSRTVLVGFLTGVGIQVGVAMLGDMFGVAVQCVGGRRAAVVAERRICRSQTRALTLANGFRLSTPLWEAPARQRPRL
jgi:hypothetical protein